MINIVDLIVNLFGTLITYFAASCFFSSFGEKKSKPFSSLLIFISFAALFLSLNFLQIKAVNMLILALCSFTVALRYDFKLYNRLLFTVLFVIISALAEFIAGLFVTIAFSLDFLGFRLGEYSLEVVLSKLLTLVFIFIVRSFNVLIIRIVDGIIESNVNENKLYVAEEMIKRQTEQYELLLKNNDEIIRLRHDYKNFVIGILTEIRNKNYKTIEERLTEQASVLERFSSNSVTGNSIIDTVLSYKTSAAGEKGIDVRVSHKYMQDIYVSGIDMAILLGNALDNAIEASERLTDTEKKYIDVVVHVNNGQIFITVKNAVRTNVDVQHLQTTKENSFSHGYGILNMRSIAQKYDGSVTFDCEENVFSTFIILKNVNE